jgi:plastocyanin
MSLPGTVIWLACAALLIVGCGAGTSTPSTTTPAAANTIVIKNFAFAPMTLTVAPGATVTVKNEDTATHTVSATGDVKAFDTGNIAGGATKTFTAPSKAGSYSYICDIHNYMQGTLTVT